MPLLTVLWADTLIERYGPGAALAVRTHWRKAQKMVIEPFLPLDRDQAGPVWPLTGMVDTQRFLVRPGAYLRRMAAFVWVCTAVHYWDGAHGLTVLWAASYTIEAFILLALIAGFDVWVEHRNQDFS